MIINGIEYPEISVYPDKQKFPMTEKNIIIFMTCDELISAGILQKSKVKQNKIKVFKH